MTTGERRYTASASEGSNIRLINPRQRALASKCGIHGSETITRHLSQSGRAIMHAEIDSKCIRVYNENVSY